MRDTRGIGRPGWQAVPDLFLPHHQHAAEAQATATVRLWAGPHTRTLNDDDEYVDDWGDLLTDDPIAARIQQLASPQADTAGGQQISTRDYQVSIAADAPTITGSGFVEPVTCTDPTLVGMHMPVTDILRGSLLWQRDLLVTDVLDLPAT